MRAIEDIYMSEAIRRSLEKKRAENRRKARVRKFSGIWERPQFITGMGR